jgi:DNA-binding MarR family transcriptional regulator
MYVAINAVRRQKCLLQFHPIVDIYSSMSMTDSTLTALTTIDRLLHQIDDELGLQLNRALLQVALYPGQSINELAQRLAVPQQTASRYVAVLQGRYELPSASSSVIARNPLVTLEISGTDPRRRAIFLTPDGKKRINRLLTEYRRDDEQYFRVG